MTRFRPLHEVPIPFETSFSLFDRDWQLSPQPGDRYLVIPDGGTNEIATIEADGDDWNVWSEERGDRAALTLLEAVELSIRDHLRS